MIKPTLGYPTRTAAVEAMLAAGLDRSAIAKELGGTVNSVQQLIYLTQQRVNDRKLVLQRQSIEALRSAAARRQITPVELAGQLLELIVRDDLFDALLGEAEAAHA